MSKLQDIRDLAQEHAVSVSGSPRDWMDYMNTASRLYRYSFSDQLLIHAQHPEATACASLELWNEKMFRWVNRGARGIALLDETGQPKTAHTTNPVPCIFVDNTANAARYELADGDFGLANLASTIAILLGQTPDEHWLPGIIRPNSIN